MNTSQAIYTHSDMTFAEFVIHRARVVHACWRFRFLAHAFSDAGNESSAAYCRKQLRVRLTRLRARRAEVSA